MSQIPIQNIYYILCYAWDIGELRDKVKVGVEQCDSIANLLVHVLLNTTEVILKKGLSQDYILYGSEVDAVKGKIIIGETLKQGKYRQGKMFCSLDEITTDIHVNQIIYNTLRNSLRIQNLSERNEKRLLATLHRMPKMKSIKLSERLFKSISLNRNNRYYQFALNISRLLNKLLLPNENSTDKWEFVDFMEDELAMNRIFEKFLMNFYKQECSQDFPEVSRTQIRFQLTPYGMTFAKCTEDAYRLLPLMETDVTLFNPLTKKRIILDAKYYKETLVSRYGKGGKIRREHISQILSYVMNQENEDEFTKETKGILVYPTVDIEIDASYKYKNTKHVIQICTVNLNQDWRLIEKRLKEIVG